ncbi:hypothetical protein BpHYR1_007559 [Brachionus plicatilis]|uniref:Uncharacterized protein n=1 Tax=Brachionus plicatilis TaxID=10195 RepID=A0A3M7S1J7_BRAPC|nr:hypothetical protein BpHYR1_007559 [Brachionus plicatilis]
MSILTNRLHKPISQSCHSQLDSLGPVNKKYNNSEVLRMEFLFIPLCSCQEHELIIKSRCELSAKCICQHFEELSF